MQVCEGTANIQIMVDVVVEVGNGVSWVTGWVVGTLLREDKRDLIES